MGGACPEKLSALADRVITSLLFTHPAVTTREIASATHLRSTHSCPSTPNAPFRALALLVVAVLLWVASGFVVPAALAGLSTQLQWFATIFLDIFIEVLPFLFAGVLTSSAISLFVSPERIRRLSPCSPRSPCSPCCSAWRCQCASAARCPPPAA